MARHPSNNSRREFLTALAGMGGAMLLAADQLNASPAPGAVASANQPVLHYVAGSTIKIEQLIGDEDKQLRQPTLSQTITHTGSRTYLGNSFEHGGRVYFLFGDTVGRLGRALDMIGTTDATILRPVFAWISSRPAATIRPFSHQASAWDRSRCPWQVLASTVRCTSLSRPTIRRIARRIVPCSRNSPHRQLSNRCGRSRSFLRGTSSRCRCTSSPGRSRGCLPAGRSSWCGAQARTVRATRTFHRAGGTIRNWQRDAVFRGLGCGRCSDLEREGIGRPGHRPKRHHGRSFRNVVQGSRLVADDLRQSRSGAAWHLVFIFPHAVGTVERAANHFQRGADGAVGKFIHNPQANPDDGLAGPVIGKGQADPQAVHGGAYAPYVIERWTKVQGSELSIYYVLSTWNPYVVVLMKSRLHVE